MVLQRAPVEAVVWGYAFAVGDEVNVSVASTEGTIETITAAANQGKRRSQVFRRGFDPTPPYYARAK